MKKRCLSIGRVDRIDRHRIITDSHSLEGEFDTAAAGWSGSGDRIDDFDPGFDEYFSHDFTMQGGKIRIRMEAYDHQALDASAKEIVDHAKRTGARVAGPIPLPTRREIYTVNRSPFIDKKSREQFEIRTHKRIIDITEPNARTVEALNRLVVPAGVFVKIKA